MAERKKKQTAEFAKDKNAFAGGSPTKGKSTVQKMKQKQSGAHQPRDADTTSGHNVQKSGQSKTFGHDASHSVKQNHMESLNKPDKEIFQDNHSNFQNDTRKTTGHETAHSQKKRRQQKQFQKETSGHDVQRLEYKPNSGGKLDRQGSFQRSKKKTAGQETERSRRKRRQQSQSQKENSFTGTKEKTDSDNAGSKVQDGFSKEQNAFVEEGGGEQTEETKEFKNDYRRRDTYHQSEKKGRYRRRERQDRERTKTSDFQRDYQAKDNTFAEKNTFTDGAEPEFQGSRKLERLQKKAEKAGKKTEAARKKLPKKKEYSLERVFDEKTGRAKYVLVAVVKEKPFKEDNRIRCFLCPFTIKTDNFPHDFYNYD